MGLKTLGEKRQELAEHLEMETSIAANDGPDVFSDGDMSDVSQRIRNRKNGIQKKKKKKIKREEDRSYNRYIIKVFKTIHPGMQLDKKTTDVINTCCYHILEQVCEEAAKCVGRVNKKTMSSSDLQYAIKFLFPTELAKHAEMEGIMAVARGEGLEHSPQ